jgi:hypothetical protein
MLNVAVWTKPDFTARPTWSEWKIRWENVSSLADALHLIHNIYGTFVDSAEEAERLCLLLDLADGWSTVLHEIGGNTKINPEHVIRTKALTVLKIYFFDKSDWYGPESWIKVMMRCPPEAFNKLLWFLRSKDPAGRLQVPYLVNVRHDATQNFAWQFAEQLWELSPHLFKREECNALTAETIFSKRAEALKIAFGLGRLLELVPGHIDGGHGRAIHAWQRFDDAALAVLRSFPSPFKDTDESYIYSFQPEVAIRRVLAAREAVENMMNHRNDEHSLRTHVEDQREAERKALTNLTAPCVLA